MYFLVWKARFSNVHFVLYFRLKIKPCIFASKHLKTIFLPRYLQCYKNKRILSLNLQFDWYACTIIKSCPAICQRKTNYHNCNMQVTDLQLLIWRNPYNWTRLMSNDLFNLTVYFIVSVAWYQSFKIKTKPNK